MRMSVCSALVLSFVTSIAPAVAQDSTSAPTGERPTAPAARETPRDTSSWRLEPSRPAALPVLYVGYAALQGVDLWQSARLLETGAREINPVMAGATGHPAAVIAVKAATTAGTLYFVERLWKNDHRVAAIVTMVAVTGATAAVAAHNARQMGRR